jgi:hypothetical protein
MYLKKHFFLLRRPWDSHILPLQQSGPVAHVVALKVAWRARQQTQALPLASPHGVITWRRRRRRRRVSVPHNASDIATPEAV